MKIFNKISAYVEQFHMIEAGESVVVGVSGGADSVCLFYFLLEYRKKVPFSLYVVHVHHGIRKEAQDDADYVQKICKEQDVPFFIFQYDIPTMAKREKLSEEEAGRKARYQAFSEVLQKQAGGIGKIAVAHHQSDVAETVLFHMFRGSGLRGLAGIRPIRGQIIRPLLCVSKNQIESCLKEEKIPYQTDVTNFSDAYTRNKIRLHILPYASREINAKAQEHIAQTAQFIGEADDYFTELSQNYLKENLVEKTETSFALSVSQLQKEANIVRRYILMECLQLCTQTRKDIAYSHIEAVERLCEKDGSKYVKLPYGIVVKKVYNQLVFEKKSQKNPIPEMDMDFSRQKNCSKSQKTQAAKEYHTLVLHEEEMENNSYKGFTFRVFPYDSTVPIDQKKYTKWFDYDKIKERCVKGKKTLVIRTRQTGDFFYLDASMHKKRLKDYMITEKIPKEERGEMLLLALDQEVLWLPGYRISESTKVSTDTKKILEVQFEEDKKHG